MIVTVTLNPCIDHTLFVEQLAMHDTNRVSSVEIDAGGKGINASRVIANLGGRTLATGFLGGNNGAFVQHVLNKESVPHDFTPISGETRINFAVEDPSGLPPTCFNEPGPTLTEHDVEDLLGTLDECLRDARWLLVAGSAPPGLKPDIYFRLGQLARKHSVRYAADLDGKNMLEALKSGPDFVKPNVAEAGRLLGRTLESEKDVLTAAVEIRERILRDQPEAKPIVIVSRGADGAVLADGEGVWRGITPKVDVQSTVGSGDSMVAAFLTSLDQGKPVNEALAMGMAAGAATAQMKGSGLATLDHTQTLLPECRVERVSEE